jgi:hypothetical protein
MGAAVFSATAAGRNAEEAFAAAVKQAQDAYGHAGYTGTIAEKDSFVFVSDVPMAKDAAEALGDKLINDEDERVDDQRGPAGCIPLDNGTYYFFGWSRE